MLTIVERFGVVLMSDVECFRVVLMSDVECFRVVVIPVPVIPSDGIYDDTDC